MGCEGEFEGELFNVTLTPIIPPRFMSSTVIPGEAEYRGFLPQFDRHKKQYESVPHAGNNRHGPVTGQVNCRLTFNIVKLACPLFFWYPSQILHLAG